MSVKIKALKGQAGVRCAGRRRPRCSLKKWEAKTKAAVNKVVKAIAVDLQGLDRRPAAEQMAVYFAIGRRLQEVVESECTYGTHAMREIVERLPELKDEGRAYEVRDLSMVSEEGKGFILDQTRIAMSNGEHLTLGHWLWLMRHKDWVSPTDPGEWVISQLAWLRTASPPADVLDHIEAVWAKRHSRELEDARKKVQRAIGLLESW